MLQQFSSNPYIQKGNIKHFIFTSDKECDFGKYGVKCSETCGYCHNQSHCQNVDGFCSEGCSAGYKGFLCTERKYNVYFIDIIELIIACSILDEFFNINWKDALLLDVT